MKHLMIFVVWLCMLATPCWAGFDERWAAYERRDYATAFRDWLPLAQQGDAGAQHTLSLMYTKGHGVPQDYAEALKWYRRAAEQGFAEAQHTLGCNYSGWR